MCGNSHPAARPFRGLSPGWPSLPLLREFRSARQLASLLAAAAPVATAAVVGAASANLAAAGNPQATQPRCAGTWSPPLASFTIASQDLFTELLGPRMVQLATQWMAAAGSLAQRFLEKHLAELHQGGCPATSAVLRAHLYGAALQVVTLGFATCLLTLDRAAILHGQVWRLLSWSLVHGGPLHLALNYIALAKLGPQLEQVAGRQRFTAIYVGSAAAATVCSLAVTGRAGSLGASGVVFGLAAALWRYQAAHSAMLPAEAAEALWVAGQRALQVALGYHVLLLSRSDVGAHVGGAVAGWALAALLGPDFKLEEAPGPRTRVCGFLGLPSLQIQMPFGVGTSGVGNVQFRDQPRWQVLADPKPRSSIPFPALGLLHSVTAAAALVTGVAPSGQMPAAR